jgi:hypothetical protein
VTALCRRYTALRYGGVSSPTEVRRFTAAVRAFRPRDSRAS